MPRRREPLGPSAPYSSCSSPTTGERSSEPTRRTASSTPGMNDSRSTESWRIVSVWPAPPKMHLLVGHQAGQAHRVDRLVHVAAGLGDQLGRPLGGARRGVELAVVVQLDDLALRHVAPPPRRRTSSSAPRRSRSWAPRTGSPPPRRPATRSRRRWCPSRSARPPRGTCARWRAPCRASRSRPPRRRRPARRPAPSPAAGRRARPAPCRPRPRPRGRPSAPCAPRRRRRRR